MNSLHAARLARFAWRACCIFLLLLAGRATALGQDLTRPRFVGIQVGFDGRYTAGAWTQIDLLVRGGNEPMTVVAQIRTEDGDGVMTSVVSQRPASLLPGQIVPLRLYVKPGRIDPYFNAELIRVDDGDPRRVADHGFESRFTSDDMHPGTALEATEELLLNIGPSIGVDAAIGTLSQELGGRYALAQVQKIDQLPTRWYGYDGVSVVVLPTSQPEAWRGLTSTSAQLTALDEWVKLGGTLLLSAGTSAAEALAPDSPLARFVPGKYQGPAPLRQLRDLETFAGATQPLSIPVAPPAAGQPGGEARLDVPQLIEVRGRVEVREGAELPLVVRAPYGFGEVIFVALDLDRPPLSRWNDRGKLVARLLDFPEPTAVDPSASVQQHYGGGGYNDISGQLRRALDDFVGVKIAPFALVALLIAGYILLIGPVDYWIVKRVFKRMELTWITFPLIVVAVSTGAYLLASWMKGDKLLVNQVQLVDVDLSTNLVRGNEWVNVFSPAVARYEVAFAPKLPDGQDFSGGRVLASWLGKADPNYGMNSPGGSTLSRGYSFAPNLDALDNVPIQFWSTKAFSARWDQTAPQAKDWITVDLKPSGNEGLEGKIINNLAVPLQNAKLLYRNTIYPLQTISAKQEVGIDPAARVNLQSELRSDETYTTWSTEVDQILPRMMLQEAIGPTERGQLGHRYQEYVDLSGKLELGQAMLIGQVPDSPLNLQLDGEPAPSEGRRSWTFYRFVIPVQQVVEAR